MSFYFWIILICLFWLSLFGLRWFHREVQEYRKEEAINAINESNRFNRELQKSKALALEHKLPWPEKGDEDLQTASKLIGAIDESFFPPEVLAIRREMEDLVAQAKIEAKPSAHRSNCSCDECFQKVFPRASYREDLAYSPAKLPLYCNRCRKYTGQRRHAH